MSFSNVAYLTREEMRAVRVAFCQNRTLKKAAQEMAAFEGNLGKALSLNTSLNRVFKRADKTDRASISHRLLTRISTFLGKSVVELLPELHPLRKLATSQPDTGSIEIRDRTWRDSAKEICTKYFHTLAKAVDYQCNRSRTRLSVNQRKTRRDKLLKEAWGMLAAVNHRDHFHDFKAFSRSREMDQRIVLHPCYTVDESTPSQPVVMCPVEIETLDVFNNVGNEFKALTIGAIDQSELATSLREALQKLERTVTKFGGPTAQQQLQDVSLYYLFLPGAMATVRYMTGIHWDPFSNNNPKIPVGKTPIVGHHLLKVRLEIENGTYKIARISWNTGI